MGLSAIFQKMKEWALLIAMVGSIFLIALALFSAISSPIAFSQGFILSPLGIGVALVALIILAMSIPYFSAQLTLIKEREKLSNQEDFAEKLMKVYEGLLAHLGTSTQPREEDKYKEFRAALKKLEEEAERSVTEKEKVKEEKEEVQPIPKEEVQPNTTIVEKKKFFVRRSKE